MGTVVGTWRLKLMIVLITFITCIYTANAFLMDDSEYIKDGYYNYNNTDVDLGYNASDEGIDSGDNFINVIFGIGDFLTFGVIDNTMIRLFLTSVTSFTFIGIGYIIYTFIKEWIPFV